MVSTGSIYPLSAIVRVSALQMLNVKTIHGVNPSAGSVGPGSFSFDFYLNLKIIEPIFV